jgi:hypothetical protein
VRCTPATLHAAIEYIITKAVLEGKTGDTIIHVPLTDFAQSEEGPKFTEDAAELVLRIDLTTSWENTDDVEDLIVTNLDEEEDEEGEEEDGEDTEEFDGDTDSDSESH